jgi:hypothetical protein
LLTGILTEKANEIKDLAKGEKGERLFPTLYILYSFSFFPEKWSLTTLTFLTFAHKPLIYLAFPW